MKLPDLVVGAAGRHRAVTVLPLFTSNAGSPIAYRLGAEAVAAGVLEIDELAGGGAVDRLRARNRGTERVLLLEGDHLIGAKQNRVLTSSAIVGGKRELTLPVSCVEQGRWEGASSRFAASATLAPAGVRRILKLSVTRALFDHRSRTADQSRIWSTIADHQRRLRVTSATCALAHTYAARAPELHGAAARLPYVASAAGVALGIGDELVSIDLFDKPQTCAFYWRQLVDGAVLEALGREVGGEIGNTEVQRVVDQIRAAAWAPVAPVGDGEELRATTTDTAASALVLDGRLVHFGLATGMAAPQGGAVQSRPMRRELPEVLAERYTIVARIGVGGAKEVFRATDTRERRDVAIARLPGVDPDQFAEEVALARRVRSRYVPELYDSFVDPHDDGYLVMEYCDGKTLAQLAERALPVAEAGPILVELARAVASIHAAHVLHRDIKLENVLLCARGDRAELKVLDFGLSARARDAITAVHQLSFSGTLPYMPREAIRGTRLDARSDVYSFGVCCYRLLVGEVPAPPGQRESEYEYVMRLSRLDGHDLARLPALPALARELIARMLRAERDERPFMPEVVAGFERAFGGAPIAVPRAAAPPPQRRPPVERVRQIAVAIAAPGELLVAPCPDAPLIALVADGAETVVTALGATGDRRWSRRIAGRLRGGLRADLDGDGVRELYLAGPHRLLALDATGAPRFDRPVADSGAPAMFAGSDVPGLLAIPDPRAPRLVVDGRLVEPRTGADLGPLVQIYDGNGRDLVPARGLHGASYNGVAMQAFRGHHGTGAAIIAHPGAPQFHVAHLERDAERVMLVIYGPGGERVHAAVIAEETYPQRETSQLIYPPPLGMQGPLAALARDGTAIAIAPLLGTGLRLSAHLAALELPSGRVLWSMHDAELRGPVLLADLDGSGAPALLVGDGTAIRALDPRTGAALWSLPCEGAPIACGDPFASGFTHLITASRAGIELWRGAACPPGALQWSGPRADLWGTGALRATGTPYGPV